MNLVWIRGSAPVLRAVRAVAGAMIDSETAHPYGDAWRVQAYASDEAITAMRALGATVDVVLDTARLDAQFENARAQIQDVPRDDSDTPIQQSPDQQSPAQQSPTQQSPTQQSPDQPTQQPPPKGKAR